MAKTPVEVKKAAVPARTPDAWQLFRNEMDRLSDRFSGGFGIPSLRRMFEPKPNWLYEGSFSWSPPAIDITEDDKAYKITADYEVPSLEQKNLDVTVSGDLVTIKGEKGSGKEKKDKDYHVSERAYGSFQRSFALPDGVDRDKIAADLSTGVLTITLPKTALDLEGGEKVLEIGTGSGYAAAVLAEIAAEVYTVERIGQLADKAASTLEDLGYSNVHVVHGDGTLGWAAAAPYDAIVVAAGGPEIPGSLKEQLKLGGRLIIPVGTDPRVQELVRVTRISDADFKSEDIADVRFVPLVGKEGWAPEELPVPSKPRPARARPVDSDIAGVIAASSEAFNSIGSVDLAPLPERIGDAKIVLLGEATHGTSEFYRMRERISQELITRKGFRFVAIEGDWPDVARLDHYVRHFEYPPSEWTAFARFPTWMWRNNEVRSFMDWLHGHNEGRKLENRVAIYGLDLYSLYTSIRSVLKYLDEVDPDSARIARQRYGCLTPWQTDPATYGHAALTGAYRTCETEVVRMLADILHKQPAYAAHDGERFLDAVQNARLVTDAERYYRIMYYGSRASWNLRDTHMFQTLKTSLAFHGPDAKAIVWAHNSHVGDAAATEMSARGEYNIGLLCREEFGNGAYSIGFGTHAGTVAAASDWDGPMEVKTVLPSLRQSYEWLCHETGRPQFMLPLRGSSAATVRNRLAKPHLERAIGVIYRPETELASHYFQAVLPAQFDEYVWFDETRAVTPLGTKELEGLPDTYPFGL